MNESIKVSVIVPIYNSEKFVEKCISSILQQTYGNFELLLVDDGSTDNSLSICLDISERDNRIKVYHNENQGVGFTRKFGVEKANGDVILFIDSDDYIEKNYLEEYIKPFYEEGVEVSIGSFVRVFENKKNKIESQYFRCEVYNKEKISNEIIKEFISNKSDAGFGIAPSLCNKMFAKALVKPLFEEINGDIIYGEDACITFAALKRANVISILDYSGYFYVIHASSSTHKYNRKMKHSTELVIDWFRKKIIDENTIDQVNSYFTMLLTKVFKNELLSKCNVKQTYNSFIDFIKDNKLRRIITLKSGRLSKDDKVLLFCLKYHIDIYVFIRIFLDRIAYK